MRIQALILLVPFAVFLMETASYIPSMQDNCAMASASKSSCITTGQQGQYYKKQDRSSCSRMKKQDDCSTKKKENKKPCDNNCKNSPDCSSCPVCYSFIFQPQYEWEAQQFIFNKDYRLMTANYIFTYASEVWKPPNGFHYSL